MQVTSGSRHGHMAQDTPTVMYGVVIDHPAVFSSITSVECSACLYSAINPPSDPENTIDGHLPNVIFV